MKWKKKYFNWLPKKQSKQESGRLSTQMEKEKPVSYLHQQQPGTPSAYSLHQSIRTLPYENFILILTNEDLGPLIISGAPPVDELVTAWENITEQYSDSLRDKRSKNIFECYKKIIRTQAHIRIIDTALTCLEFVYDEEIAESIADLGYPFLQWDDDTEAYLKKIESIRTAAKTLIVMLNQYTNEYKMLSPGGNEVKRDYQSYIDELAILGKHQNTFLRAKEITVQEYCAIVNSFMAYHEQMKKNG